MMMKPKAPTKQKMSNSPSPPHRLTFHLPSTPALPPLPDEVVVSILARISKSYYSSLCLVSKSFYTLLSSPEINTARTEIGAKEPRLYMYFTLPKPEKNLLFTLSNPVGGKLDLAPVRLSYSYAPARLNSTSVAVGSEIYQIGGSKPSKAVRVLDGGSKPSKAVRVLDCRSHTWRRAPRLTVARKNAKSCFLDGKIYVMGGREDESMNWGEVFDIETEIWTPLPCPDDDNIIDSNLQVVVVGGRVNVITKQSKYVYDTKQGRWRLDVSFVDIKVKLGPCCVIDDVMFGEIDGKYKWFNSRYGKWIVLEDLDEVYKIWEMVSGFNYEYKTIQLVNHGGKLVIIWHHRNKMRRFEDYSPSIWCAVIRLEKCLTPLGTQICGEVERCSFLHNVPNSYQLLCCLSVSL